MFLAEYACPLYQPARHEAGRGRDEDRLRVTGFWDTDDRVAQNRGA